MKGDEMGDVLQKLIAPAITGRIAGEGLDLLRGSVIRAVDAVGTLTTPTALWRAHGWEADGEVEYADVLRFLPTSLMTLEAPAIYPSGFLQGDAPTPVWWLDVTRVPTGAELWRVLPNGEQRLVSAYAGPALGWRGAKGYTPPVQLVGPRAVFEGQEYPAAFAPEGVELVALGDTPLAGSEETRPGVRHRVVPVSACERVFELRLTCVWRGVPWRIVQSAGEQVLLSLIGEELPGDTSGLVSAEPGVYEAIAPTAETTDLIGTTRELSAS